MIVLTPSEALEVYSTLVQGMDRLLKPFISGDGDIKHFDDFNLSFNPLDFDRSQLVKLLRLNSRLQLRLEDLSSIIEYVPFICRKYNLNL